MAEKTNKNNINKKLKRIEKLLDLIEEDLEKPDDSYINNIICIVPHIKTNWKLIAKDQKITMFQLIDICEQWAIDLSVSIVYNRHKVKNKKITAHIYEAVNICRFIMLATHRYLHDLNHEST